MSFEFKQKQRDFYVSESLPFELSGQGDAFYVYFEKRNKTTHEVIEHMQRKLKLSRLSIGIAWLKDKKAVAKQRISIYDRALTKAGGERVFTDALSEIAKVLETWRHDFPLNLSVPIENNFHIKLRSTKNLGQGERQQAIDIVAWLLKNWYPNLFGVQRFGMNGRNKNQGYEIMTGTSKEKFDKRETVFKLQAYASHVFNDHANKRNKNRKILDGDILSRSTEWWLQYGVYTKETKMVRICQVKSESRKFFFYPDGQGKDIPYNAEIMIVTGPIPWFNTPLARPGTAAWDMEARHFAFNKLSGDTMGKYKEFLVYGLRRALWVYPSKTRVKYIWDDLVVDFTLPAWSYASIVFDSLLEKLR